MGDVYKRIKNTRGANAAPRLHSKQSKPFGSPLRIPLPVFDLAPLTEFATETFAGPDRDLDAFVLMLALAYNDLKGFEWTYDIARRAEPPRPLVHPQVGQVVGMKIWAMRFTVALLNELLDAIHEASKAGITAQPRFKRALNLLDPRAAAVWRKLERLANKQYDPQESAKLKAAKAWFVQLRSNLAHHYKQPKPLRDAYLKFFLENPPSESNRVAFASLGRTMEQTRFFFADAAALEYYTLGSKGDVQKHVNELRNLVNGALLVSIHAYLELRKRELTGNTQ